MRVETVVVGQLESNCHLLFDEQTRDACVIDPGDEPELIIAAIDSLGLRPLLGVFTHAHYDHVCAARELRDRYNLRLAMHRDDLPTYMKTRELCVSWGYEPGDFPAPDILLSDGESLSSGSVSCGIIHTPGHSPGSICILSSDLLFSGDTLFRRTVGRTDLPGGDPEALLASLARLARLPGATRVLPGHDEETLLADEISKNPFFQGIRRGRSEPS